MYNKHLKKNIATLINFLKNKYWQILQKKNICSMDKIKNLFL